MLSLTATDLFAPEQGPEEKGALDDAKDFIREILSDGPVLQTEIEKQWSGSERTLRRAKNILKVKSKRRGFGGPWCWQLRPIGGQAEARPETTEKSASHIYRNDGHLCKGESLKGSSNRGSTIDGQGEKDLAAFGGLTTTENSIDGQTSHIGHLCDWETVKK